MLEQTEDGTVFKFPKPEICNLIDRQEVQVLVNRALGYKADVYHYSLQPYSAGKIGFLGCHQRLSVEVGIKNRKETLSFFIKTVPYDVPTQAEYVISKGVFQKETAFYRDLVPQLCHGYKGNSWAPTCYLVKNDLIVFEDLGLKGFSIRNKLFDKELVAAGLTSIARLHASSLLAEARLGMPLKEIYPYAFEEKGFSQTGKTRKWFDVGVDLSITIAKQLGLDPSLIRTVSEEVFHAIEPSATKCNVLSHGDLWGNNLMFNTQVPPKCLLIDFQLVRYTPLAHDVAQFLYLCTDRSFRENWEEIMLRHYYAVLCETLKSSQSTIRIPPWSELIEGMEEQRLGALITAIIFFPTVLMDEDLGAQILNDPVTYAEYVFQNRDEAVLTNMKNDPVYGKRIAEAVTELVELSIRFDKLPKPS